VRAPAADPASFDLLVDALRSGRAAIAPGDTMYGLVGIVPTAEGELRRLKGRGDDKPFLLLLRDESWLSRVTDETLPPRLARHWPGPLTVVLRARAGGTVAVRVPALPFLVRLLGAVDAPLYSTSVNRAGSPPLTKVDEMCREFEDAVALVYDGGDAPPGPPSTLVDATTRPCRILRQGVLPIDPADMA
jgi:L-threonylcarbamoyladenylate synthase